MLAFCKMRNIMKHAWYPHNLCHKPQFRLEVMLYPYRVPTLFPYTHALKNIPVVINLSSSGHTISCISFQFGFFVYILTTRTHRKHILVLVTHNKCIFLYEIGGLWIWDKRLKCSYFTYDYPILLLFISFLHLLEKWHWCFWAIFLWELSIF